MLHALAALATFASIPTASAIPIATATAPGAPQGAPPTLQSDLGPRPIVRIEETVTFTLTVSEPDGDPVDLVCLNPPTELQFGPVKARVAPFEVRVRWRPGTDLDSQLGSRPMLFEVRDVDGSTALTLDFTVLPRFQFGQRESVSQAADVTGDGVMDLVVLARRADVGGITDTGAAYLWRDGALPSPAPSATLSVPAARAGDSLGSANFDALQIGDVTGDGIDDVLIAAPNADDAVLRDSGAIYVWRGGTQLVGNKEPFATLIVPGTGFGSGAPGSKFPDGNGQPVLLSDVHGRRSARCSRGL